MKRIAIVYILGAMTLFTANTYATVTTATIEISAMIDGRDWLIISGNTLQWHHLNPFASVGRHWGQNEPTIISTWINDVVQINQAYWFPDWPENPPAEIRYEATSSVFTGLFPSVPPTDMVIENVTLVPLSNRWTTSLLGFTEDSIIIEFNDNPPSSHYWYKARINIEMVPEPATVFLLGLGGLALLRRKRGYGA